MMIVTESINLSLMVVKWIIKYDLIRVRRFSILLRQDINNKKLNITITNKQSINSNNQAQSKQKQLQSNASMSLSFLPRRYVMTMARHQRQRIIGKLKIKILWRISFFFPRRDFNWCPLSSQQLQLLNLTLAVEKWDTSHTMSLVSWAAVSC